MVMDQRKEEYYQVLELSPDASRLEIEQAYTRFQKLFSPASLATYSMMPPNERDAILTRIEEAYRVLTGKAEECRLEIGMSGDVSAGGEEDLNVVEGTDSVQYNGAYLRRIRESRSISLEKVESVTKISQASLQLIENDAFEQLPARIYVRGFVILYARFLGLSSEEVAWDYMKNYDERITPDSERKGRRAKGWRPWGST